MAHDLGIFPVHIGAIFIILTLLACISMRFFHNHFQLRKRVGDEHSLQKRHVSKAEITLKRVSEDPGYASVFPPSQRATAFGHGAIIDLSSGKRHVLELSENYKHASPLSYVFSGFSVPDILSLGDFPDYARLSGVPLPSPLPNFNIATAKPRPYRPFRWVYHQTMSFKRMDPDFWIELESSYAERIRQRQQICAKHGKAAMQALPGSELACKELMEMVLQFLCARYPGYFQLVGGNIFVNHILGTRHDLAKEEPLHVLRDNVPEDFALTLREKAGQYVFRAGIICSSIGWSLGRKMGLDLDAIHQPVPDYKEKMQIMRRYFSKMPTSNPIQRGSWGLSRGQPLFEPGDPAHASLKYRNKPDPSLKIEEVFLRTDWQTMRRLPLSGAIVFNFKVLFTPVTEFEDEPYIPSLVLKTLNDGKENLMEHKGTRHVEHVVKPVLEMYERRQVEQGLIERDWEPRTLEESPFFPGWEKKWRTI
ncbi:hypothetical protein NM208_g9350 [Fusarium decemcellulare]|uniref:Uncharacterized protein n=1 Tax=Fusarium decemcellulare TaxID=57161 RepID=A0ACC1S1Z4_9HYPO|nr:hypothetical protein NM208_g9350 [Fusarium decemcellulare]